MDIIRKVCRLCLSETDFSISLHSTYCRKTNMIDKILVCLKIVIEETDTTNIICYRCANSVEKYYDFIAFVKKCQVRCNGNNDYEQRPRGFESPMNHLNRRVTSYVREQVFDADYTFSFLEMPEDKKELVSSPFFSYFSPPQKQSNEPLWKTPRPAQDVKKEDYKMPCKTKSRQHSRDFFDSQSQEADEPEPKSLDWKLTPDDNIIKRVRDKCFGRSDF
uniref:ZAD domain-containing protein n=1 Tax=Pectinophora gossypiella TaxID=13191 RepID=A0A1E1VZD8_PECGO